jgi:hypothetical protein
MRVLLLLVLVLFLLLVLLLPLLLVSAKGKEKGRLGETQNHKKQISNLISQISTKTQIKKLNDYPVLHLPLEVGC